MGMNKAVLALSLVMAAFVVGAIGAAVVQFVAAGSDDEAEEFSPPAAAAPPAPAGPPAQRRLHKPTKIPLGQWLSSTEHDTNVSYGFNTTAQWVSPSARETTASVITRASNVVLESPTRPEIIDDLRSSPHSFPSVKKIRIGEWNNTPPVAHAAERSSPPLTAVEGWINVSITPPGIKVDKRSNAKIIRPMSAERNDSSALTTERITLSVVS